jgi:Domain of unknown function (DUF4202)
VQSQLAATSLRIVFSSRRPPVVVAGSGGRRRAVPETELRLADWRADDFSFPELDRRVEALADEAGTGPFAILLSGAATTTEAELQAAARQVAIRCQRLRGRRNAASTSEPFTRVLAGHRRLYGRPLPQVVAAYAHAVDTWQWLLRLEPEAGQALQLAALFHDVERLTSAAEAYEGQAAPSSPISKDDHARRGAWIADELLAELGIDLGTRVRVHRLIRCHERLPGPRDPAAVDLILLNDADALSFFSLSCAGYLDSCGAERTARKVAYTVARLSVRARPHLAGLRLPAAVARLLDVELARPGSRNDRAAAVPAGEAAFCGGAVRAQPTLGTLLFRSRRAVGMLGGAGLARTRVSALLARAAAMGALAARPGNPRAL